MENSSIPSVLLYDVRAISKNLVDRIADNALFDVLVPYEESAFYDSPNESELKSKLNLYFNSLFDRYGIDCIEEVYTEADLSNSFALYVKLGGIPCNILENAPNQMKDAGRYEWGHKDRWLSGAYYSLQKKLHTLCGEDGKSHLFLYPESDSVGQVNFEIYDFNSKLNMLPPAVKARILHCFDLDLDKISGPVQLLLTNSISHCVNTSVYNESMVPYIYQIMMDYYGLDCDLILKQHPHDKWSLQSFLGNPVILDSKFPVEFIRIVPGIKINAIVSGYTTSAWRIRDLADTYIEAGLKFFRLCHVVHDIFVALTLMVKKGVTVIHTNIPLDMVIPFSNACGFNLNFSLDSDCRSDASLYLLSNFKTNMVSDDEQYVVINDVPESNIDIRCTSKIRISFVKKTNDSLIPADDHILYACGDLFSGRFVFDKELHYENAVLIAATLLDDLWTPIELLYDSFMNGRDTVAIDAIKDIYSKYDSTFKEELDWLSGLQEHLYEISR